MHKVRDEKRHARLATGYGTCSTCGHDLLAAGDNFYTEMSRAEGGMGASGRDSEKRSLIAVGLPTFST